MKIQFKKNYSILRFDDKKHHFETMLKIIEEARMDKVIYVGEPLCINYKNLKKLVSINEDCMSQTQIPIELRNWYNNVMQGTKFCIILKGKN